MNKWPHSISILRTAFLCVTIAISLGVATNGVAAQTTYAPEKPPAHVLQEPASGALSTSIDWITFLGGEGLEGNASLALDNDGSIYVAGASFLPWGSPIRAFTSPGVLTPSDVFVAKLDPHGELLWSTFLGGDDVEAGGRIAVDDTGNIYVCGWSMSTWGSPVRPFTVASYSIDTFVAKLSNDGNVLWNTFLGSEGYDECGGIDSDEAGSIYVTGGSQHQWTCSPIPCTKRPFVG